MRVTVNVALPGICLDESTVNKYIDNNAQSTCKISLVLIGNNWISDPIETLIDTGAAFSCVNVSILNTYSPGQISYEQSSKRAVNASGHRIGIIGQVQLKLKITTGSEKIVINGITFQILHDLSVHYLLVVTCCHKQI